MSVTDVTSKLATLRAPSLDDLGGMELIERMGAGMALDLHADRMVAAIAQAPVLTSTLADVVIAVIENNSYPLVVGAALLHARTMRWPDKDRRRLQRVLLGRVQQRSTLLEADMASECLAGAFLLAADGQVSRLAFLNQLEDVHAGEHPIYLRRAARIAGLAWVWDRTPEVRTLLERLKEDSEAGDQALYELGLIQLDDALEANDREAVLLGLSAAADTLEAALRHDLDFVQAEGIGRRSAPLRSSAVTRQARRWSGSSGLLGVHFRNARSTSTAARSDPGYGLASTSKPHGTSSRWRWAASATCSANAAGYAPYRFWSGSPLRGGR